MNDAAKPAGHAEDGLRVETETKSPIAADPRYPAEDLEARLDAFETAGVVNISAGGMAIETSKHLRIGRIYPLRLLAPSGLLRLEASVVWSRLVRTVAIDKAEVRPVYRAGVKFCRLTAKQERTIAGLIRLEAQRLLGPNEAGGAVASR